MKLRNAVIKQLQEFKKDVDFLLVDELIYMTEQLELCKEAIAKHGIVYESDKGNVLKNPASQQYLSVVDRIITLSKKLGLSHTDRVSLGLVEEKEDGLAKLMKNG